MKDILILQQYCSDMDSILTIITVMPSTQGVSLYSEEKSSEFYRYSSTKMLLRLGASPHK